MANSVCLQQFPAPFWQQAQEERTFQSLPKTASETRGRPVWLGRAANMIGLIHLFGLPNRRYSTSLILSSSFFPSRSTVSGRISPTL